MAHHRGVAIALGQFYGVQRFGQGADLVDLDQDRVADTLFNAFSQDLGVGDEEIVAHQLNLVAQTVGQDLPARPVTLAHAVFDRDDRVLLGQAFQVVYLLLGRQLATVALLVEVQASVFFEEFGSRAIQADANIVAQLVASLGHGRSDHFQRFFSVGDVRCETAFITHGGRHVLVVQHFLQVVEHFSAHAQGFAEGRSANRDNHQLLEVQAVVGVFAAVDHVHHRHRQRHRARTTDIAIQRQTGFFSSSLGYSHRNSQDGVGAQTTLVVGAVQIDHGLVDESLVGSVEANDGFADFGVDVFNGFQNTLAQIAGFVAIAQFQGFTLASGCAGRYSGTAHDAGFEQHVGFDGRVATGVQNLAGDDFYDCAHLQNLK